MVRKERLELSHPKILVPKTSASTNSATLAKNAIIQMYNLMGQSFIEQHIYLVEIKMLPIKYGVDNGTRTHDDRHHKPGLYQLSYTHHKNQ